MVTTAIATSNPSPVLVRVTASHADIMVTVDGQVGFSIAPGDVVRIGRAPRPVRLVRFGRDRFYRELRERLGQGKAYTIPGEGGLDA